MRMFQTNPVLHQFIYESEEWQILLAFLKHQNVFYKATLADIVSKLGNDETLSMAEKFNEEFASLDKMIDFLSSEIKKQTRLLETWVDQNDGMLRQIKSYQKKLRNDICMAEEFCLATKERFCLFFNDVF